jgi:hypothetical protein
VTGSIIGWYAILNEIFFSSISNDQILYQFQEMKSRMKMLPKQPQTTSVNGMFSLLNT